MIIKKSISNQIFDYIIDEIKFGNLKPGDKLPGERDLAESLGVSRVPLREAIRSLSLMGVLKTRHGEGTFVNHYTPDILAKAMNVYMLLDKHLALELMEVRKIMEAEAAKLASQNATRDDIKKIKEVIQEREEIINGEKITNKEQQLLYELDRKFHQIIAESTHNSVFTSFIKTIKITLKIQQQEASQSPEMPKKSNNAHKKILEAIIERDAEKASKVMYEHLEEVEEIIKINVKNEKIK